MNKKVSAVTDMTAEGAAAALQGTLRFNPKAPPVAAAVMMAAHPAIAAKIKPTTSPGEATGDQPGGRTADL